MDPAFVINDMHRPFVDDVVLLSLSGKKMFREPDLIDVWFDSGAMPYAQWGLPPTEQGKNGNISAKDFLDYWNTHSGSDSETGSIYPAEINA